jgi:hypothetical protein
VVVLDEAVSLPEGMSVKVELLPTAADAATADDDSTLYDRLEPFIGKAESLPPDLSVNLDHYLYGTPKQA